MKKIFGKVNEKGTLLVEAMAMLGLIAMVTPVLYKKAAERTVELQDVNASSQLRALSSAVDSYIKDNFAKITKGDTINGIDYSSFKDADNGAVGPISLSHFADYLPYGFLNNDGSTRETKLFTDNYNVWIKLEADYQNYTDPTTGNTERKALSQILTGFVSAKPKNAEEIGQVRASRIASMIGSNGGYVIDGTTVMGAQGIWSVPVNEFNNNDFANNTFVVSSLQPISSQGLANEDVLHRKDEPDADQELNTMETDLFMGFTEDTTRNIRMVNQIIMNPDPDRMVGSGNESAHNAPDNMQPLTGNDATDLDKALYITKGGGAYLEGALNAMNSLFSVNSQGIRYFGSTETEEVQPDGSTKKLTSRAAEPLMKIDGTSMVYGNPGAGNAKLTVNSAGNMSYGSDEVKADDGTVTEGANVSLYADKTNFKAGDGALRVSKEENAAGGNTAWVSVFNQGEAHEGGRTTYTWNGAVPTEDAAEATGKYEVSINGSAFVKDTLLTGKIKSYNVDAATLRAGVDPEDFDDAADDIDFYTVTKQDSMVAGKGKVLLSVADKHIDADNIADGRPSSPAGVSIRTDAENGAEAPGLDIILGNTSVRDRVNDAVVDHYANGYATDDGTVRIGAANGIYLSAYDADGRTQNSTDEDPVRISLNGDTFTVSKRKPHNNVQGNTFYNTVDSVVDSFNVFSTQINTTNEIKDADNYWRAWWSRTLHGRMYVGDTAFIVGAKNGNPVFEAFPVAGGGSGVSTGTSYYPDYGASIKMSGGIAIYDYDYNHLQNSDNITGQSGHGRDAAIYANKGRFEIRATDYSDATKNLVKDGNNLDKILVVDSNKNTTYVPDTDKAHGSVYIRKGSMNLATYGSGEIGGSKTRLTNTAILNQYAGNDTTTKEKEAVGYIAADRFVSQFKVDNNSVLSASVNGSANVQGANFSPYEYYEVNPAYTSVMHDIKLTTRGGARLSDILPDFINKGIYVVDTTYTPNATWVPGTTVIPTAEVGDSAENEVSAFAGFIPTPKCPPGYAKVVTLTPSGWAMAQAGTPVDRGGIDIMSHNNPMEFINLDPTTGDTVQPLTFQKSTWLKAMVLPYCGQFQEDGTGCGENFRGWGAILGFIYPHSYYTEFINQAGLGGKQNDNDVYWNLFPVYYKQLEGYATVYCYFDRKDGNLNSNYVDKAYDQLSDYKTSPSDAKNVYYYEKNHGVGDSNAQYINRLNDPNLKYKDPW